MQGLTLLPTYETKGSFSGMPSIGLEIPVALHMRFSFPHAFVPWVNAFLFLKTLLFYIVSNSCRFRYACRPQTPMSMHQETKDLREINES